MDKGERLTHPNREENRNIHKGKEQNSHTIWQAREWCLQIDGAVELHALVLPGADRVRGVLLRLKFIALHI